MAGHDRLGAALDPGRSLSDAVQRAVKAESLGYESAWVTQLPGSRDAAVVLAAFASATSQIGLGTGVLPIYTRHPTAMVQMAATLDEQSGGRFRLGIGISHRVTVEGMWGMHLEHPVDAMREYLEIVRSSLAEGFADYSGTYFSAHWSYSGPRRPEQPVLISALNPRMLELAGERTDGVVLWMCSAAYIERTVVPAARRGRENAGKTMDGFEIVAMVPVSLTTDAAAGRDTFKATAARYAALPFYRRMMDASGFAEELARGEVSDAMVGELAGIGGEAELRTIIQRYRDAGCTLPVIGPFAGHEGAARYEATLEAVAS